MLINKSGLDQALCDDIVDIGKRMYASRFVAGNDGNISALCAKRQIWMTPTGVSKGYMDSETLIKMDFDGNILEGVSKASTEAKMHIRVYEENPSVKAVVHAHPYYSTLCAILGIPLDMPVISEVIIGLGMIPVVKYAEPGSASLADNIAPFCKDFPGVLLSNHGAMAWGNSVTQAYYRLERIEFFARITLGLKNTDGARLLSNKQIDSLLEFRHSYGEEDMTIKPIGAEVELNQEDILPNGIRINT